MSIGSDFKFLYWDDLGDSQEDVDNQKKKRDDGVAWDDSEECDIE